MAGMVSAVNIGIDKQGKRYGKFLLSNFNSKIEMRLKGDNLVKYENFFKNGMYLLVHIKKDSFVSKENGNMVEFDKILDISLLENVWAKVRKLDIVLDAQTISNNSIMLLKKLVQDNKGKTNIYFCVYDGAQVSDTTSVPSSSNPSSIANYKEPEEQVETDVIEELEETKIEVALDETNTLFPSKAISLMSRNMFFDVHSESIQQLIKIVSEDQIKLYF
jgi:DNA polymerase III alpha subunit